MTAIDPSLASGLGDDRQTYRYPMVANVSNFESQMDALAASNPGTRRFYVGVGHAGDDPLQEIVVTPWRIGAAVPLSIEWDPQSFFQIFVYQAPKPEIRSVDELVLLGHSPKITRPEEYAVIPFEFKSGSTEYMKFIYAEFIAHWADTTKAPVWRALPGVTVSLMFEGYRNWIAPEKPLQTESFETFKRARQ